MKFQTCFKPMLAIPALNEYQGIVRLLSSFYYYCGDSPSIERTNILKSRTSSPRFLLSRYLRHCHRHRIFFPRRTRNTTFFRPLLYTLVRKDISRLYVTEIYVSSLLRIILFYCAEIQSRT